MARIAVGSEDRTKDLMSPLGDSRKSLAFRRREGKKLVRDEALSEGQPQQTRSESALGLDTEIPQESPGWRGGAADEGFAEASGDGAGVGDHQWKDCTGPCAHVFELPSAARHQFDCAVAEGNEFTDTPSGVCAFAQTVLGKTSLGQGIFGGKFGQHHGRDDKELHRRAGGRACPR